MGAPKQFKLFKDEIGKWRWRLSGAGNGYVIAECGEGYDRKEDAVHGARLVSSIARDTAIWNEETSSWEP